MGRRCHDRSVNETCPGCSLVSAYLMSQSRDHRAAHCCKKLETCSRSGATAEAPEHVTCRQVAKHHHASISYLSMLVSAMLGVHCNELVTDNVAQPEWGECPNVECNNTIINAAISWPSIKSASNQADPATVGRKEQAASGKKSCGVN